jgi:ABC-type polysaccharide/polyol phosphate export permease
MYKNPLLTVVPSFHPISRRRHPSLMAHLKQLVDSFPGSISSCIALCSQGILQLQLLFHLAHYCHDCLLMIHTALAPPICMINVYVEIYTYVYRSRTKQCFLFVDIGYPERQTRKREKREIVICTYIYMYVPC